MVGKIRPRKIIMPSELTGNQRRKRLSGPVITYQLSQMVADSFPSSVRKTLEGVKEKMQSTESFTSMDSSEQQSILLELVREGKSDVEIGDMLDMSQWQVRNLRYKLGIKKDRGGNVQLEPLSAGNRTPSSLINLPQVGAGQELVDRGLVLRVSGTYTAREVAQRLKALASLAMVDSDSMQYHLSVTMTELTELEHAAEEEEKPELNENEDDSAEDSESSARVS
ncbi:MAG: hypothetical protein R6U70_04665 [Bacillota bacterium]